MINFFFSKKYFKLFCSFTEKETGQTPDVMLLKLNAYLLNFIYMNNIKNQINA